ncbi:MAG: 3-deoxy-manno-octulosonate cytidylyltransferase [Anaerolineae bacterium]|nr:3-deoxy-manno-octulosonate cytidylyltransferase [Phycisphaerae bacterium]
MSSATVIIPARFGSSRFPAKILAADTGRPLVQHVVDQVGKCKNVKRVIVATDDQRIVDALQPFGTRCVMTSAEHQSGTDRIAEVARTLEDEIIVNVQGDEPEIEPATIDALIDRLQSSADQMSTAATRWPNGADPRDPNLVKVVVSQAGHAMYFSRAPIPFPRDEALSASSYLLHQGIYAYRRDFLLKFASLPQTELEKTEKLEQLRVLENGHKIGVMITERAVHGIDTPEQYANFVKRSKNGIAHGQ